MRRSHHGERCTTQNLEHRAKVAIEDGELAIPAPPKSAEPEWRRHAGDPRWPVACEFCGHLFSERDERLLFFRRVYRDESGHELILDEAPLGAMWDAWWLGAEFRGRDGCHLAVLTPGGPWTVDGRSPVTRLHWARIGTPPKVTVKPSLFVPGRYHGWLEDGVLYEV